MDGFPRPSTSGSFGGGGGGGGVASSSSSPSSSKPQNLRSSVSMFIEDSRITAVANANAGPQLSGPPGHFRASCPPTSFYSVTQFTSSSLSSSNSRASSSWNLRPATPATSTFPDSPQGGILMRPRACSSSPVRFPRGFHQGEMIHNVIPEIPEEVPGNPSENIPTSTSQLPPPSTVRRRTTLSVEPQMSFINVREELKPLTFRGVRDDRAYTSVNLTLRSPTNSGGGGGGQSLTTSTTGSDFGGLGGGGAGTVNVVNCNTVFEGNCGGGASATFHTVHHSVQTGPGGSHGYGGNCGGNLMYSTYSSNSRDGFEAQVQIHFGPGGGTFTASRRRSHNISIVRQMNSDLLSAQTERKDKLRVAIQDRRCLLATLQTEIVQLRSQLQLKTSFAELENLKQKNQRLRIECDFMAREVDLYQHGSVPLGETDEEFYQGINPGQSVEALFGITNNRRKIHGPPPRPPPPKFLNSPMSPMSPQSQGQQHHGQGSLNVREGGNGLGGFGAYGDSGSGSVTGLIPPAGPNGEWRCSMCTFLNHRDLAFCEQCQMVRVKQHAHHPPSQLQSPHQGQSREQNIRIRVRRNRHLGSPDDSSGESQRQQQQQRH